MNLGCKLLKLDRYVDMIIPRGGAGLHELCKQHSTIPVIVGGVGVFIFLWKKALTKKSSCGDRMQNANVQAHVIRWKRC